jgi:hypothetical protein
MGNFPGLSPEMSAEVVNVFRGNINPLSSKFVYRRQRFHNRVAYAAAGQAQLSFFTTDPSNVHVGNLRALGLQNETFAWVYGARCKLEQGATLAGAASANGAAIVGAAAPGVTHDPYLIGEQMRIVLDTGVVNLTFGDKKVIEDLHGLYNFPAGGGVDIQGSSTSNSATTAGYLSLPINNGQAFAQNMFEFTPGVLLLPQKRVKLTVDWPAAFAVDDALIMKWDLDCLYVTPSNN